VAAAAVLWGGCVWAADAPLYQPPAAWVKPVAVPATPAKPGASAVQVLLTDQQSRFGPDGDEFYVESAFRILTPPGLAVMNGFAPSWNPQTDTLILHRFNVLRDGKTIDMLGGGKNVTVIRREKNLELAMIDGDLTASLQPEGIQVSDVVDIAFTLVRRDPVMQGISQGGNGLPPGAVVNHALIRAVWPAGKPVRWRASDDLPAPKLQQTAEGTEFNLHLTDYETQKPPTDAPPRFAALGQVEFSQFRDWAQVSALMAPLYAKAETLAPASPLLQEAAKIRAAYADPKARAAAALRLVQDQVRYTFVGLNLGGYVPADADVTWTRRFGDCKGKTALLIALLHELGIEAQPALVSTVLGDGLDKRLPEMLFDHVLVRATIAGKVYWLDGTRSGDRALDDIAVPDFHWTLPVQPAGAQLVALAPTPLDAPEFESLLKLDASAGLEAPAPAHAEHLFRGDEAVVWNLALSALSHADAERNLREYWRGRLPWIDVSGVSFAYDDAHRVMRLAMDGKATMDWTRSGGARFFQITDSNLGFDSSFEREPGLHADAPFAAPYPIYHQWTVDIVLPSKGLGFGLVEASDLDETIAARTFHRRSRIVDGVATMVATERTLSPEFPASEAPADALALRALSRIDVNVATSATSDEVQQAAAYQPDALESAPASAVEFDRRASNYLHLHDYPHALADLDKAVQLDPTSAQYVYNRGAAHYGAHQDDLALADFNRALELKPTDSFALLARGELYLFRGDEARGQQDFDAAVKAAPGDPQIIYREARALEQAGRFGLEAHVYDALIAAMPSPGLYNARCWARGEANSELVAALADCDAALKLRPGYPAALDSRGFVDLRLGRLDDAVRDYTAALQAELSASSLFGRGLAEVREGKLTVGEADIASAIRLKSDIAADFSRLGVVPPAASAGPAR
jgi:tetratricopeptide (TPR) repeat protein